MKSFVRQLQFFSCCVVMVAALGAAASPAEAAPINALTFTGNAVNQTFSDTTRGYAFDVTAGNLVVTGLSMWDLGGNGLSQAHQVGLWDPSGALIASATVPAGTLADLIDGFRVVDIPDLPLLMGSGYVVGAFLFNGSFDSQALGLTGLSTASGISLVEGRFLNGPNTLSRPTSAISNALVGGSLMVDTVGQLTPVPEPASLTLFGLGLAGVAGRRWRQRRS